ncbi:hypothetical protein BsWGS_04499 [Bradybaena similaris]
MKLIVVFVSLAVACVLGAAPDPTKVCLPEVLEADVYSATTDDYGKLAIDFKKGLLAVVYLKAEIKVVINLTNFEGNSINITDRSCKQILAGANIANVVTRCLPASAKLLTNGSSTIGVPPNSVSIEGWEIDIGIGVTRVALTTGNNAIPIIREYRSGSTKDVAFYSNQRLSIADERIFDVPDDCEPLSVVG